MSQAHIGGAGAGHPKYQAPGCGQFPACSQRPSWTYGTRLCYGPGLKMGVRAVKKTLRKPLC